MSKCQAQPRRVYSLSNWTCTGEGLVTVMQALGLPVVVPMPRLFEALREGKGALRWSEFTGGDHFHMVLPQRQEERTGG